MSFITSNLGALVAQKDHLEASVITFIVTASGVDFLGLGAAFWGVVAGGLAYWLLYGGQRLTRAGARRAAEKS